MLKISSMFSDHMVLQRDKEIAVWGQADAGAPIAVQFTGKTASTTAGADGKWLAKLPAISASSEARVLHVQNKKSGEEIRIQDVLVGEVWLGSGQSNMQWSVVKCRNNEAEIAAANFPLIRLFNVPQVALCEKQENINAKWEVCSPKTVPDFSAAAYFFGRELHQQLGIPVGLINSSWGGTRIEAWMSREALLNHPPSKEEIEKWEATPMSEADKKKWEEFALDRAAGERKMIGADPENLGFPRGWASLDFDDSLWKSMDLPRHWQNDGHEYSGVFWFRRELDLPADWAGKDLELRIGACDKHETTYFNGEFIGAMGWENNNAWCTPRVYKIPGRLVRAGKNVISVRVYSYLYHGGMTGPADIMRIFRLDKPDASLPLTGPWRFEIEHNLGLRTLPQPPFGPANPNTPFILFNSMMHPIIPFSLGGFLWYQGESNAGKPHEYRKLMPALIRDWRRVFAQGNIPFSIVQLPNYQALQSVPVEATPTNWALLREAQNAAMAEPRTGVAVTIEIGEPLDIHPTNKQDVGKRLAWQALAQYFGKPIAWSGPLFKSHTIDGNAVVVQFDHTGTALRARDGGEVKGFAIAGADGVFHWADATVNSHSIRLTSKHVPKPVAARYAWANNPVGNLVNSHGLPAGPFRTDVNAPV